MNNRSSTQTIARPSSFERFTALDEIYNFGVAPRDLARFGRYGIANAAILDAPIDVVKRGYVLTNPSQIETFTTEVTHGQLIPQSFAYFRQEPKKLHLGRTDSVPLFIRKHLNGQPYLAEFTDAMVLPGEDPRVTRDARIRGLAGKIHNGWLISTTVATPVPDRPAYVESIKQIFYWGETLGKMDVIAELPGAKNTTLSPAGGTAFHAFARLEKPHTTYLPLPDITDLTRERIESQGIIITDKILPKGFHGGPNFAKDAGPGYLELDSHEAYVETLPPDNKWVLHYRTVQYGYELPRPELPGGRLIPLGVIATRKQFPDAPAKPPEDGILSYEDVVYGSKGNVDRTVDVGDIAGQAVFGLSDSTVGYADVIRIG